jgi:hypothetical protein
LEYGGVNPGDNMVLIPPPLTQTFPLCLSVGPTSVFCALFPLDIGWSTDNRFTRSLRRSASPMIASGEGSLRGVKQCELFWPQFEHHQATAIISISHLSRRDDRRWCFVLSALCFVLPQFIDSSFFVRFET